MDHDVWWAIIIGFAGFVYFMQRWIDDRVRKGIADHEREKH